jgi:hypothetical protein
MALQSFPLDVLLYEQKLSHTRGVTISSQSGGSFPGQQFQS